MRATITFETGEHVTGELYAVEVWDDGAVRRAHVAEIEVLEIEQEHEIRNGTTVVLYPGEGS